MTSSVVRIIWFGIVASMLAIASHFFFGSVFAAGISGSDVVVLQHSYKASENKHELTGMILVPSTCHDLTVRSRDVDANTVALIFETWEKPYAEDCVEEVEPRAFSVVAFAPKEIDFMAVMDGSWLPISVISAK